MRIGYARVSKIDQNVGLQGVGRRLRMQIQSGQGISNNIVFSLNVFELRAILFQEQAPSHYTCSVKVFVAQVLMVSVDD